MIRGEHVIQCMTCFCRIISEVLPENLTIEKFDFLRSIIHPRIIKSSVRNSRDDTSGSISIQLNVHRDIFDYTFSIYLFQSVEVNVKSVNPEHTVITLSLPVLPSNSISYHIC